MTCSVIYSTLLLALIHIVLAYDIPNPRFIVHGRFFQVSIPYEDGIQAFCFTANINSKLTENSIGSLLGYAFQPDDNGHLTSSEIDCELQLGDKLHYALYVKKNGMQFAKFNLVYTVTKYKEVDSTNENSNYEIPEPNFRVYRKGFEVSIPYEDGMELFAFTAKINSALHTNSIGNLVGFALQPDANGLLTCRNDGSELHLGDILYYEVHVGKNEVKYVKRNLVYTVKSYAEELSLVETSKYRIPDPAFKIYRKGFEVWIPYAEGMQLFAITANINSVVQENSMGSIIGYAAQADKNGLYLYRDVDSVLLLGDLLYYTVIVDINGVKFSRRNLVYRVEHYEDYAPAADV